MHRHRRPGLHTAMRVLAAASVLAFALSAISFAYAAGRYSARPDAQSVLGSQRLPWVISIHG